MKIKATESFVNAVTGEVFRLGHEYTISDEHAEEYIGGKLVEEVVAKVEAAPAEAKPKVEKASK